MITHIRTAVVRDNMHASIGFAIKISEYLHQTYGRSLSVNSCYGGNPFAVCWITSFESLGDLEAYHKKVMSDPKYIGLLDEGLKYFVEGSAQDTVWSSFSTHH